MDAAVRSLPDLDDSFARDVPELVVPWRAAAAPSPELLALNDDLAIELGLDPDWLRSDDGIAILVGDAPSAPAVAQGYAGHQFGGYSPRLGDGRALLLGELRDGQGGRRDLHLKGSGATPFARGGDGMAAVGPMLREYVIAEAMHALGIPTTRSLAVVATGELIARDTMVPGAVLARVASSHLRVGTFQYAASHPDEDVLRRLADHAIGRHHPHAADGHPLGDPYLALYDAVVEAQATLIARWMLVGFVHGVMNTDNMTISGETIDYGPCAFMDAYDPATVFSSIDVGGRYAYGNQPQIAHWNLARLGEALLPLLGPSQDAAVEQVTTILGTYPERYHRHWWEGMRAKLGLVDSLEGDEELVDEFLGLLHRGGIDHTSTFRSLSAWLVRDDDPALPPVALGGWGARWRARVTQGGRTAAEVASGMDAVNPLYIPRNHKVEEALAAATAGDPAPFQRLVDVVTHPFVERPGSSAYTVPAPGGSAGYRTYCGT